MRPRLPTFYKETASGGHRNPEPSTAVRTSSWFLFLRVICPTHIYLLQIGILYMNKNRQQERAATPAVAAILIVVITVVLGTVVAVQFTGFTSKIGGPTSQATFEYAESPVGIEMIPKQIAQDVAVEINGKQVATFDRSDAGNGKLIPTSPGDHLTVVAADGSRSVLVSRTVDDREEIGDFSAHYTFEAGSGDTLVDRSGNEN